MHTNKVQFAQNYSEGRYIVQDTTKESHLNSGPQVTWKDYDY